MSTLKTILRSLILAIFVIVGLLAIAGEEINLQNSVRVVVVLTLLLARLCSPIAPRDGLC
jgi:hypothetical protein